jgi:hypothetical protein
LQPSGRCRRYLGLHEGRVVRRRWVASRTSQMGEWPKVDSPGRNLRQLLVSALRLFAVAAIRLCMTTLHGAKMTFYLIEDGGCKPALGDHHADEPRCSTNGACGTWFAIRPDAPSAPLYHRPTPHARIAQPRPGPNCKFRTSELVPFPLSKVRAQILAPRTSPVPLRSKA